MQNPNYIEAKDILEATNGGLDIIFWLYPQAMGCDTDRRKKFKLREDEKTASANLHKATDGNWLVTDFGGDTQPRNGIGCYQYEKQVDFVTALRELATLFNVAGTGQDAPVIRAEYSEREAEADAIENTWTWEVRNSLEDFEIEAIISKNILKEVNWKHADEEKDRSAYTRIKTVFQKYRWHPLVSYSLVKNRKLMTFSSTPQYPIFLIDEKSHQKLYQPFHPDKGKRFMYIGTKPKDFIHGLDQLLEQFETNRKKAAEEKNDKEEENDRAQTETLASGAEEDKSIDKKARLDEVIQCSGGSDALNVALLGYWVIWLNSETAKLQQYQFDKISYRVVKYYQLQDIDATGKAAAHELAMKYLDIYTIELPEDLKKHRDRRGNPCKDVRDYFNHYKKKDFTRQLAVSLPYRFWEKRAHYEGRGDNKVFIGHKYDFKNVQANNFLMKNGFGRLRSDNDETEWMYVKRTGNLVKQVDADMLQDFIHDFLEERNMDIDLRDAMMNTSKLNNSTLTRIKPVEINFNDFTESSQFYFFRNKTVEVTKDAITYHKPGMVDSYIWERELFDHPIMPLEAPFTITRDELGNYDIDIHDKDCLFMKYLVQVSRIHWRTELETGDKWKNLTPVEKDEYLKKHHIDIAGPNLSEEEIEEQKLHLISKIFGIGFMLHRYHDRAKPWCIYAMDGKLSEDGRSHGGSGKSILVDLALGAMLKTRFFLNGRNRETLDDRFKYDGITPYHRYILIDDCHKYMNVGDFLVDISQDLNAPQKGKGSLVIPYEKSGKFAFSSNFPPRELDPSVERRLIYLIFSDYYHNHGESDDYLESRDPISDLGESLIVRFNEKQLNHFYHTMLYCLKFYLGVPEKLKPAMENVNKRTLLAEMGETGFHDWAIAYFSEESGHVDKFVVREYVFETYKNATRDKNLTPNAFLKRLAAFCKYYGYGLNPKVYQDKKKKIIKKAAIQHYDRNSNSWVPTPGAQKETKELLFIQTRAELPENPHDGWPAAGTEEINDEPKLDF